MNEICNLLACNEELLSYFHYHLNGQDVNDNSGDNELCLVKSNQNTVNVSYLFKFLQINVNE